MPPSVSLRYSSMMLEVAEHTGRNAEAAPRDAASAGVFVSPPPPKHLGEATR